jgi:hypothetical protein
LTCSEKNGHGMECGGEHGGSSNKIRLLYNPYIANSSKCLGGWRLIGRDGGVLWLCLLIEVEKVAICGVVYGN